MSVGSEKVKRWRKNTKNRIVVSMGGKCAICGYDKCHSALALHHKDPSKKEFGLGAFRANIKSWTQVVQELRKCVMLCHNCHNEFHAGVLELPDNLIGFNEDYAEYRAEKIYNCKSCNKSISPNKRYCSDECKSKCLSKIDWQSIDLVRELEYKSVSQLAREIGCSDNAIHKRLKKLGLK